MEIKHEGIKIELTSEQVRSIEQQTNRKSPEALFKELVLDSTNLNYPKLNLDSDSPALFWFDHAGKAVCYYVMNGSWFWVRVDLWENIQKQMNWEDKQTRIFLKSQIEKHFKIKDFEPTLWI